VQDRVVIFGFRIRLSETA